MSRCRPKLQQIGLFGADQSEIEGFGLVAPEGDGRRAPAPHRPVQSRLIPAEKPDLEVLRALRGRRKARGVR